MEFPNWKTSISDFKQLECTTTGPEFVYFPDLNGVATHPEPIAQSFQDVVCVLMIAMYSLRTGMENQGFTETEIMEQLFDKTPDELARKGLDWLFDITRNRR